MAVGFSLELPEEVVHVRDWVHEFAEEVIRPAAAEWDEHEETPWPIIAEAAKVGLYTPELFVQMAAERSGVGLLTVFEPTRFLECILRGFGAAKAYGCGLMLIRQAPAWP